VPSRRAFLSRALLVAAAAGGGLFLVRDRLPWPPPAVRFANDRATPWLTLADRSGLIAVTAQVNGRSVQAVIDSGAQFTAIDRRLAEALRLPRALAAPLLAYGVSGGPILSHTVRLDLAMPGLEAPDLRAAVLDLSMVAQLAGRDFGLLLGRDLLRHVVLEADLPARRARLLARPAFRPPPGARELPIVWRSGAPLTPVRIEGGPPIDVLVDTGSTNVLALSETAARRAGLLAPGREVRSARSVSVGGLSLSQVVTADTLRAGEITLRDVEVFIYRPSPGSPAPDGLLGAGLFRRHHLALDLGGNRLYLSPPGLVMTPRP
jgi:predicted aspartyl protease